jgi:hypothetical protein
MNFTRGDKVQQKDTQEVYVVVDFSTKYAIIEDKDTKDVQMIQQDDPRWSKVE